MEKGTDDSEDPFSATNRYSFPMLSREIRMFTTLTLRRSGSSVVVTLPKDQTDRLNLSPGDRVFAIETVDGILLTPHDPAFEQGSKIYSEGATKYRNALRDLPD